MTKKITAKELVKAVPPMPGKVLLGDVREMIETTRREVAQSVNSALVMLYWKIGRRIRGDILKEKRAKYGDRIVAILSQQLTYEFGRGFSEKSLRRMIQFAEVFSKKRIVASLLRQLSWSHFTLLLPLKEPLQREFYAEMCRVESWSVRTLRRKLDSMLYERTALSRKPDKLFRQELRALRAEDRLTPDLVIGDGVK